MSTPERPTVIETARAATSKLRDVVREGTSIRVHERDRLVMAIHAALDELEAAQARERELEDNLRLAQGYHQACERARIVESTRNLLRGTVRGFRAGENADAKAWRERAEAAEAELARLRADLRHTDDDVEID